MLVPEPEARITRYEVSCAPRTEWGFIVFVAEDADGWAVVNQYRFLNTDGVWTEGSDLVDDADAWRVWRLSCRFDLDTAMRLAKEVAPLITVNGKTTAQHLADMALNAQEAP